MMRVEVVSLDGASKLLKDHSRRGEWQALISIGDPDSLFPKGFRSIENSLRLEFHDVDSSLMEYRHELDKETPPSRFDVIRLIEFARRLQNEEGKCLIHCHAGVSRSTAAGFIANCVWLGPGFEEEAMKEMLAGCHQHWIFPNDIMVDFADKLLKRGGKMNACLHRHSTTNARMY